MQTKNLLIALLCIIGLASGESRRATYARQFHILPQTAPTTLTDLSALVSDGIPPAGVDLLLTAADFTNTSASVAQTCVFQTNQTTPQPIFPAFSIPAATQYTEPWKSFYAPKGASVSCTGGTVSIHIVGSY